MAIFEGFSDLPEAQAVAVQTALTQVAKTVEDTAEQDKKDALALSMAYDALDLLIGAPGPVDYVAKQIVIPQIPAFFRWIVAQLHELGIFEHGK